MVAKKYGAEYGSASGRRVILCKHVVNCSVQA